jgi:DNA/RNA endonuclease YhcR with UshA esterase domain
MKLMTCCLAVVLSAGLATAQIIDIDDIQFYNPDTGAPASPYAGQTVTVQGVVYVIAGTYNSGTHYIQDATGGIQFFQAGTGLQIGDIVEVTGTVSTFSGEIQIGNPSITLLGTGPEPTPIPATPTEIKSDYEWVGNFVAVTGFVTARGGNWFELGTDLAEDLYVYIDSDTGIDISGVDVGDEYLVKSPVANFNGSIQLKPRMQSDLIENPSGDTAPIIENIRAVNYVPLASEPIVIRARITDDDGIVSANLYFRNSDSENPGPWQSVAMVDIGGDLYEGVINPPHPQRQVDYYLEATDTGSQTVTNPGAAPEAFYSIAIGLTSIYTVQYVDPAEESQSSPLVGKVTNVKGVVTAGTGQVGAPSRFVIQEQQPGPHGGYAFGGLFVFEGTATNELFRGDLVEIGGTINEFFGLTQILPHNGDAVNLVAFGAELPEPARVNTRVLADREDNLGEAWECVWVKTYAAQVVTEINAFGEYNISDTGAVADSVVVRPYATLSYEPVLGDVVLVEGFMEFAFGQFRLVPIADEFVTLTGMTPVQDTPTVLAAGGYVAVYPNPFNPATTLHFVVNREELTQLNIYNLRGELVRSLVHERLPMGQYQLVWDGTNDAGQSLASGQYFARLRIGPTVTQVRKLSLVK